MFDEILTDLKSQIYEMVDRMLAGAGLKRMTADDPTSEETEKDAFYNWRSGYDGNIRTEKDAFCNWRSVYNGYISYEKFDEITEEASRKIKRIVKYSTREGRATFTVESMTHISYWTFWVDFNRNGEITGAYSCHSDNQDSKIPDMVATNMHVLVNEAIKQEKARQASEEQRRAQEVACREREAQRQAQEAEHREKKTAKECNYSVVDETWNDSDFLKSLLFFFCPNCKQRLLVITSQSGHRSRGMDTVPR